MTDHLTNQKPELKWGATRMVLLTRRYAFKFPRPTDWKTFLHGLIANMQERTFGRAGWPELCPVSFSLPGGWLVVMPRCEPYGRRMSESEYALFTQKPDYVVPVENKPDSFGWLHKRLVAVDYGS